MLAIQAACPGLFDRLLLRSKRSEAINESRKELDILSDVAYINIRGICLLSNVIYSYSRLHRLILTL